MVRWARAEVSRGFQGELTAARELAALAKRRRVHAGDAARSKKAEPRRQVPKGIISHSEATSSPQPPGQLGVEAPDSRCLDRAVPP